MTEWMVGIRGAVVRGSVRAVVIAAAWTPALLLFAELAEPGAVVVLLEP